MKDVALGDALKIRLLLEEGVDVKDEYGNTPLILASKNSYIGIVKHLLAANNVNVNSQNGGGFTALMLVSNLDVLQQLLAVKGIDVNARGINDCTALMFASQRGFVTLVKKMVLVDGIIVNAQNRYGFTALMMAVYYGKGSVVRLLLAIHDVDINLKDIDGNTALMIAAENGHMDIVKILVRRLKISEIRAKNNKGENACSLASTAVIKKYLIYSGKLLFSRAKSTICFVLPKWFYSSVFDNGILTVFSNAEFSLRVRLLIARVCGLRFSKASTVFNSGMHIAKFKAVSSIMRSAVLAKIMVGFNSYLFMNMLVFKANMKVIWVILRHY